MPPATNESWNCDGCGLINLSTDQKCQNCGKSASSTGSRPKQPRQAADFVLDKDAWQFRQSQTSTMERVVSMLGGGLPNVSPPSSSTSMVESTPKKKSPTIEFSEALVEAEPGSLPEARKEDIQMSSLASSALAAPISPQKMRHSFSAAKFQAMARAANLAGGSVTSSSRRKSYANEFKMNSRELSASGPLKPVRRDALGRQKQRNKIMHMRAQLEREARLLQLAEAELQVAPRKLVRQAANSRGNKQHRQKHYGTYDDRVQAAEEKKMKSETLATEKKLERREKFFTLLDDRQYFRRRKAENLVQREMIAMNGHMSVLAGAKAAYIMRRRCDIFEDSRVLEALTHAHNNAERGLDKQATSSTLEDKTLADADLQSLPFQDARRRQDDAKVVEELAKTKTEGVLLIRVQAGNLVAAQEYVSKREAGILGQQKQAKRTNKFVSPTKKPIPIATAPSAIVTVSDTASRAQAFNKATGSPDSTESDIVVGSSHPYFAKTFMFAFNDYGTNASTPSALHRRLRVRRASIIGSESKLKEGAHYHSKKKNHSSKRSYNLQVHHVDRWHCKSQFLGQCGIKLEPVIKATRICLQRRRKRRLAHFKGIGADAAPTRANTPRNETLKSSWNMSRGEQEARHLKNRWVTFQVRLQAVEPMKLVRQLEREKSKLFLHCRLVDKTHPEVVEALSKSEHVGNFDSERPLNEIAYLKEPSDMEKLFKTVRSVVRNTKYQLHKKCDVEMKKEAAKKKAAGGKFAKRRKSLAREDTGLPGRRLRQHRSSAMHPWQHQQETPPIPLSLLQLPHANQRSSDALELAAAKVLEYEHESSKADHSHLDRSFALQKRLSIHSRPGMQKPLVRAPLKRMSSRDIFAQFKSSADDFRAQMPSPGGGSTPDKKTSLGRSSSKAGAAQQLLSPQQSKKSSPRRSQTRDSANRHGSPRSSVGRGSPRASVGHKG